MYSINIYQMKTFALLLLYIYLICILKVSAQERCSHMSTNYSIIIKCTPNADAANYTSEAWLKAPNIPINIRVQDRGAYFLNLSWDIFGNTSSEYHEITYQKVGDSAKQTINTSANTFYNLTSLSPGSLYTINIVAITLNVRCIQSEPLKASTAPLPPISLTAVPWTTSRINISWSHPDSSIQTYQVKYLTLNNTELNTTCTSSPCTLSPVVPSGQTVTIAVYSVKNEICSAAVTTQSSTKPKIVSSLEGSSKIAGLSLRWTAPENSEQIRYIIYITSWADNQTVFIDTTTKTSFTRELDNLTGGIFYEVNIQAKSYFAEGDVYRVNIFTIPQPVSNLQGFAINTTALNISWNLPSRTEFNETIVNILKGVRFKIFDTTQRSQVIPNLIAGNSYNVSVQVISKYNTSSPSPEIIQEFTTKPVKPKIVSVAAEETAIAISLTREIDEGKFDSFVALLQNLPSQNSNDKVYFQGLTPGTRYTFVAYSVSGKEKSEQISVDVFTKPKPPRSLTVTTDQTSIRVEWEHTDPANLDNFTVSLYKLGADAALIKQLSVKEYVVHFPNLEAGVNYNVTVVAVKGDQKSKEEFKENTTVSSEGESALVGGVTAAVLILIILIIIAIILVIKIRNKPQKAVRSPHSSWEQSALSKLSRPVKLVDFPTHVMKMSSDSDFKYAEEYEDLKDVGRDQPCAAAEFPPNRPKNRFTNILPYDHSRVKLLPADDEEGSDYINANYMPGFNSKREYIATQGPLPSTRDDFWRMIWEQNSRNIVMLTRCEEKGREKSDHYWPNDSEPKFYGDLQVHILNETHMPDWTISEFKVAMGDQSRNVRHFHYLVWPDFGVPSNCTSLIRFVRTVREKLIREGGPMVTHCSAGVGRSGTFIVLDHLLQLIREKDEVDIFSLVYKLRKERVLMVQTEQQYKFIHECLLCVLEEREEDITYVNVGQINAAFEDNDTDHGINMDTDDEGINVETS